MRLTNKLGLPEPIVLAVSNDGYTKGDADLSVTQLISPPRQVALIKKHEDEISEDASDRIFSLMGQAIHTILERANKTGIAERRLSTKVLGWQISGGMDLVLEDGTLYDYKTTTGWQLLDGKVPDSWVEQLNCYAEILRQNGEKVTKLLVCGILRDWSKMEAMRNAGFPQEQVIVREIPLWDSGQANVFLADRVLRHQEAQSGKLPECTPKERWARPDVFAVMKKDRKSAVKLYENEADAEAHAATETTFYTVKRPGMSIRCSAYCNAAPFCTQWAAIKETQA